MLKLRRENNERNFLVKIKNKENKLIYTKEKI